MAEATDAVEFAVVTPERWDDFARLFERRGSPSYCWCMAWRGTTAERDGKEAKRAAMERRVLGGEPVGILGYVDGEPLAWCSVAPRETFRPLSGGEYDSDTSAWLVVCFFVARELRGQRLSARLLEEACRVASEAGADVIEGYPVDPDSPSYRFMGRRPMFLDAGFEEVGRAGSRRYVMRRLLS